MKTRSVKNEEGNIVGAVGSDRSTGWFYAYGVVTGQDAPRFGTYAAAKTEVLSQSLARKQEIADRIEALTDPQSFDEAMIAMAKIAHDQSKEALPFLRVDIAGEWSKETAENLRQGMRHVAGIVDNMTTPAEEEPWWDTSTLTIHSPESGSIAGASYGYENAFVFEFVSSDGTGQFSEFFWVEGDEIVSSES